MNVHQSGSKLQFETPILFVVVKSTGLQPPAVSPEDEAVTEVKVCVELLFAIATSALSLLLLLMVHSWQLVFALVLDAPGYSGGGKPNASIIRR